MSSPSMPSDLLQQLFAKIGQRQPQVPSFAPPPMPPNLSTVQPPRPQQAQPFTQAPIPQRPKPQPWAAGKKPGDMMINLVQGIIQHGKQKRQQQANDFVFAMDTKQQNAQDEVEFQLSQKGQTLDQIDPNQARQMIMAQFAKDNQAWLADPKVQKAAQAYMKSSFAPLLGKTNAEDQQMQQAVQALRQAKDKKAKAPLIAKLRQLQTMQAVQSLIGNMVQNRPTPMTQYQQADLALRGREQDINEQKNILTAQTNIMEHEQAHQDKMLQLNQQMQMAKMRQDDFKLSVQERADAAKETNETRRDIANMMNEYHKESLALKKELAQQSGTPNDWAQLAMEDPKGIEAIPPKNRAEAAKVFRDAGLPLPTPITTQQQNNIENSQEMVNDVEGWMNELKVYGVDPKTGQLSNDPGFFRQAVIDYKMGRKVGASDLLGKISRGDWMAVAPLLHGTRSSKVLMDIKTHTPKVGVLPGGLDSPAAMFSKLQAIDETYKSSVNSVYTDHGFTKNLTTGDAITPPGSAGVDQFLMGGPSGTK